MFFNLNSHIPDFEPCEPYWADAAVIHEANGKRRVGTKECWGWEEQDAPIPPSMCKVPKTSRRPTVTYYRFVGYQFIGD